MKDGLNNEFPVTKFVSGLSTKFVTQSQVAVWLPPSHSHLQVSHIFSSVNFGSKNNCKTSCKTKEQYSCDIETRIWSLRNYETEWILQSQNKMRSVNNRQNQVK